MDECVASADFPQEYAGRLRNRENQRSLAVGSHLFGMLHEVNSAGCTQNSHLSPGMEIGYVVKDAGKWEVDIERDTSELMLAIIDGCWRRHGRSCVRH